MNGKTETTEQPTAEATTEKKKEVLTRFTPSELEALKTETGADADATAVASFVRMNLRKQG